MVTRYFKHKSTGQVYQHPGGNLDNLSVATIERSPAYTEVKVVPMDAIVIMPEELPEVEDQGDWVRAGVDSIRPAYYTPENLRKTARSLLAIALFIEEREKSEEEQKIADIVEALTVDLEDRLIGGYASPYRTTEWQKTLREMAEKAVRAGKNVDLPF